MMDYIQLEAIGIVIVTNSVTLASDLQVIENYIKNVKNIIACFCVKLKDLNVSDAMVYKRANTTDTSCSAAN